MHKPMVSPIIVFYAIHLVKLCKIKQIKRDFLGMFLAYKGRLLKQNDHGHKVPASQKGGLVIKFINKGVIAQ